MSTNLPVFSSPFGNYRKVRAIGSGGVGQVFLALPPLADESSVEKQQQQRRHDADDGADPEQQPKTTKQQQIDPRELVIVKRILLDSQETLTLAEQEIDIMKKLPAHPNTIRLLDAFVDQNDDGQSFVCIVQEFAVIGDVENYMAARREGLSEASSAFSANDVAFLSAQILVALRHLHKNAILFRDLKPMNIALTLWPPGSSEDDDGADEEEVSLPAVDAEQQQQHRCCILAQFLSLRNGKGWKPTQPCSTPATASPVSASPLTTVTTVTSLALPCTACLCSLPVSDIQVKVVDFGVARILSSTTRAHTQVGTPCYLPPELVEGSGCAFSADVWAFGVVVWELCNADKETLADRQLFGGDNMLQVVRAISEGKVKPLRDEYCPRVMEMVEAVIKLDPKERPSVDELLKKFFA